MFLRSVRSSNAFSVEMTSDPRRAMRAFLFCTLRSTSGGGKEAPGSADTCFRGTTGGRRTESTQGDEDDDLRSRGGDVDGEAWKGRDRKPSVVVRLAGEKGREGRTVAVARRVLGLKHLGSDTVASTPREEDDGDGAVLCEAERTTRGQLRRDTRAAEARDARLVRPPMFLVCKRGAGVMAGGQRSSGR